MNLKTLFLIIICMLFGFCLAAFFYLPYVAIRNEAYSINENDFHEIHLDSIDCNAIQKTSFLNELNVTDVSDQKKSAYLNATIPINQSSELHVFGVYSGTPIIHVKKTENPATLLLSSAESTLWSIQLENDALIDKIYIFGRVKEIRISKKASTSTLSKLKQIFLSESSLEEIKIIKVSSANTCGTYAYKWQSDYKGKFRYFINTARKNTQLIERSFQGLYSFNSSHLPFEVPPEPDNIEQKAPAIKDISVIESNNYPELITDADKLMNFIHELVSMDIIPESLPSIEHGSEGKLMKFGPPFTSSLPKIKVEGNGNYKCEQGNSVLIEGDDQPNIIDCPWGNQIIYAGGGKDLIEDSWGNDIFYGGKGNDVIDAGWGSDIIIFNEGWGADIVDKTCHNSTYNRSSTIGATAHNYNWKYTNFIVFGPNIFSKDIVWKNDTLINIKTGDSIKFKHQCFNFVYYSEKKELGDL